MHAFEQICVRLRHASGLNRAGWLWDSLRPAYNGLIRLIGKEGLQRTINGTDVVRVLPEFRAIVEVYEPEVWRLLMEEVRPGDMIVDVGAFVGLYTMALAKRVGGGGRVTAFEPDPNNFSVLRRHLELNGMTSRVQLVQAAAGAEERKVPFSVGASQSSLGTGPGTRIEVDSVRLDSLFRDRRVDLLKMDVEGFEEHVLRGASELLADQRRRPRAIFIEVHPYAWKDAGTTSESLLGILKAHGYRAFHLDGRPIESPIDWYGEMVARAPVSREA